MSGSNNFFGSFCDKAMFFSLCSMICVLPVSIAVLDSFAGLAIFFYLLKKINRMIVQWPLRPKGLKYVGTLIHILNGFSPRLAILNRPLQILALAFFISVVFSQYPQLSLYAYLGKYLKYIFLYFCCVEVLVNEKKAQIFLIFFSLP